MKKLFCLLVLGLVLLVLNGCSSMGFIPPQYSLATTEYVNVSVARQQRALIGDLKKEISATLDSLIKEQQQQITELNQKLKSHTFDIHSLRSELDSLNKQLISFQGTLADMNRSFGDSLRTVNAELSSLSKSIENVLQQTQMLETQTGNLQNSVNQIQSNIQNLPQESLKELVKILEKSLNQQGP